jgi:hypothetical protein
LISVVQPLEAFPNKFFRNRKRHFAVAGGTLQPKQSDVGLTISATGECKRILAHLKAVVTVDRYENAGGARN